MMIIAMNSKTLVCVAPLIATIFLSAAKAEEEQLGRSRDEHFASRVVRPFVTKAPKQDPSTEDDVWVDLPKVNTKIVGGSNATEGAYPWMVAMLYSIVSDNEAAQFCGGTLIHPYWVLSAAHCVEGSSPDEVEILLGGHDLSDGSQGVRVAVEEIIIHPQYQPNTMHADIALLRLAEPAGAEFTPMPLADLDELSEPGVIARALGWGATSEGGSGSVILKEVDLPLVSLAVAAATGTYEGSLQESMLPAGLPSGGVDTCQGDSGGPLVVPAPFDGGWALAGVTSFGVGCGGTNAYGIYARVDKFRQFIIDHLYPGYIALEKKYGVIGELRDSNGDGIDHFGHYALRSSPVNHTGVPPQMAYYAGTDGDEQALQLNILANRRVANYWVGWSADLATWTENPLEDALVGQSDVLDDLESEQVLVTSGMSPDLVSGFMRVRVEPSTDLVLSPRELSVNSRVTGALTNSDDTHPDFPLRVHRYYRLVDYEDGEIYRFVGRSTDFDMRLELIDAGNPDVPLIVADENLGGDNDELIEFTADASVVYYLRVTTTNQGELGDFAVSAFSPSDFMTLKPLDYTNGTFALGGGLTATDDLNPAYLPFTYYKDDYRLLSPVGLRVQIDLTSPRFDLDTYLEIIDAETDEIIAADDNAGYSTNSRILFTPRQGRNYILRVTSAFERDTGSYILRISGASELPKLAVPGQVNGSLQYGDLENPDDVNTYMDEYILTGLVDGQTVTLSLTSSSIDCYLWLIDASTGEVLASDDDSGDRLDSLLTFTVDGSLTYIVRASSFSYFDTGIYLLSAEAQ